MLPDIDCVTGYIKDNDIKILLCCVNIARSWHVAVAIRNLFDGDVREPSRSSIRNDYPMDSRAVLASCGTHFKRGDLRWTTILMRYISTFYIITFILLASCSNSDQHLQKISQSIFKQKVWDAPLPPTPFKSDGCSCWPDSDWIDCCVEHDALYWIGGTREERKQADIALQKCINEKGHPYMSKLMYYGVRVGGVYWLPTSFRWGFGWSFPQPGPPNKQY